MFRSTNTGECLVCFKSVLNGLDLFELFFYDDVLCGNCRKQLHRLNRTFDVNGLEVFAFYQYNKVLEKWMYQFKENKDETLGKCFLFNLKHRLEREYRDYVLVMVPSSTEKTLERGFHALSSLFSSINLKRNNCFIKDNIKQSKQSRLKRLDIKDSIHLVDPSIRLCSKILLVDDVCTTGSSLRACYDLIKTDVNEVKICVVGLNESWIKMGSVKKVF